MSHYFEARIAQQFDAVIHLDHTLETSAGWDRGEVPETYPFAV